MTVTQKAKTISPKGVGTIMAMGEIKQRNFLKSLLEYRKDARFIGIVLSNISS